ncbi:MAG TPA: hypothetical protein DCL41_02680 [Bdellovibrionales bacterium]|nr:hypothetical protein [Bdellovibrionales bacterium]
MKRFSFNLTLLFLMISLVSCTRGTQDLSVNIRFPISESSLVKNSNEKLMIILNLRNVPNRPNPWLFEYEFDSSTQFGNVIEIPGVPRANGIVVQVLGVFEDESLGTMRLSYGGTQVNLTTTEEVQVNLISQNSVTRAAEITGRYLRGTSPEYSGKLAGYFPPPDGLPPMKVWEGEITAGWFRAIALESTGTAGTNPGLDFVVEGPGGVPLGTLFQNLRFQANASGGFDLYTGPMALATSIPFDNSLMALEKPASLRKESDGTLESDSARISFVGFFGPGVTAENKVCYPNMTTPEALPGLFAMNAAGGAGDPLEVRLNSSGGVATSKVRWLAGGVAETVQNFYANAAAINCKLGDPNTLRVRHDLVGYSAEEYLGVRPPFRDQSVLEPYPVFLKGDFDGTSTLTLTWKPLPGVSVDGFELYAKPSSSGGGGGGDVQPCQDLLQQGYSPIATIANGASTSHTLTTVLGTNLNNSNWSNFSFGLCAYKDVGTLRKYVGNYIQTQCLGSCVNPFNVGRAPSTLNATLSNPTSNFTAAVGSSGLGGAYGKVTNVSTLSSPYDHMVSVTLDSASGFSPLDEVMFMIVSEGIDACGSYKGQNLGPGTSPVFARVIDTDSSTYLKVQKGSWLEGLPANSTLTATPTAGMSHCFVQAVRVPQFRNVTFNSNVVLLGSTLQFATTPGGGVVAFRVNGTLQMADGSKVDVSQQGYPGAAGSSYCGASAAGDAPATCSGINRAAQGSGSGGAGGGAGVFANGSDGGVDGGDSLWTNNNSIGYPMISFGGGGGASSSDAGGKGGGAIFIAAEKYVGSTTAPTPKFHVNGEDVMTANSFGGGGGAGAINLLFKSSQGPIEIQAKGGDGGSGTSPSAPGNGGGGYANVMICDLNASGKTAFSDVTWDALGGDNVNSTQGDAGMAKGSDGSGGLKWLTATNNGNYGIEHLCRY